MKYRLSMALVLAVVLACVGVLFLGIGLVGCKGSAGVFGSSGSNSGGSTPHPQPTPVGSLILVLLGAAFIVAGPVVGYWLLKDTVACIASMAGGLALCGIVWGVQIYPWILPVSYGLIVVAAGCYAYMYWKGKQAKDAIPELVEGTQALKDKLVPAADTVARDAANALLAKAQSQTTKDLVDSTKEKLGL